MSYAVLPEQVLVRIMGGILTTYYRDKHGPASALRALHDLQLPGDDGHPVHVDVAIVRASANGAGEILAAYEVVGARGFPTVSGHLQRSAAYFAVHGAGQIEVGLVLPESRESEFAHLAATLKLQIVTYPG